MTAAIRIHRFSPLAQRRVRQAWKVRFGGDIVVTGKGALRMGCYANAKGDLHVPEEGCSLGAYSYFHGSLINVASVGNYCSLAVDVVYSPPRHHTHRISTTPIIEGNVSWPYRDFPGSTATPPRPKGPIRIGHDVWIGTRAVVMDGVTIGNGAIVGSCAVVTKDVPPYAIVGGVPAKVIRYRFPPETVAALEASRWWEYDLPMWAGPVDWEDPLRTLEAIREAVRSGWLKPLPPPLELDGEALSPFRKRRRFLFRRSREGVFVKAYRRWCILRHNKTR